MAFSICLPRSRQDLRRGFDGIVEFDQLAKEIRQHARKHGCAGGGTQACHRRASDHGADDWAVRMHDAGPVGGKIECREMQWTEDAAQG